MPGRKLAPLLVAVVGATALSVWALTRPAPIDVVAPRTAPLALGRPVPVVHADAWLNVDDPADRAVDDRVVLYDFWASSCANCVRTLPWVRAWWDRYRADGLVIVGVHTPRYGFEHDPDELAATAGELGVTWPVAVDNVGAAAAAFDTTVQPAFYLADRAGVLRHTRFGEGSYRATERSLRALLGVPASAPWAAAPDDHDGVPDGHVTPEIQLGTARGSVAAGDGPVDYDRGLPVLAEDEAGLTGRWIGHREFVEAGAPGAALHVRYRAGEVHMVLASADGTTVPVAVAVDGAAVAPVAVGRPGLYRLAVHGAPGAHTVTVTAPAGGLRAYAVSFGERPVTPR